MNASTAVNDPDPMADIGRIKGVALGETIRWYHDQHGAAHRMADAASLPPRLRKLVEPSRPGYGVLPSQWYPMELAHALIDRIADRHSQDELDEMAERAGPHVLHKVMNGVQRAVFRLLLNPERYVNHAQRAWEQNFRGGSVQVKSDGDGKHLSRVERFPGHHRFICRLLSSGTVPVYRAMGCREVRSELLECVDDGGQACITRVHWGSA